MKCEYGPDYIVQEYLKESMALLNCGGRKQAPQSKYAPESNWRRCIDTIGVDALTQLVNIYCHLLPLSPHRF